VPGPRSRAVPGRYSVNRQPGASSLPGFVDLTAVRYSGCPASAA
jgi:hypothetical protein